MHLGSGMNVRLDKKKSSNEDIRMTIVDYSQVYIYRYIGMQFLLVLSIFDISGD